MKKVLLFIIPATLCVLLVGCSKNSDESSFQINPHEFNLNVNDTGTATANREVRWSSGDRFIASIEEDGTVTAHHVGSTFVRAKAADGDGSGEIRINVLPRYHTYEEPLCRFGASKEEIKRLETHELYEETGSELCYLTSNPDIIRLYSFQNNRLTAASVACPWSYALEMVNFLDERYFMIGMLSDYEYVFLNDYEDKADLAVVFYINPMDSFILAMYSTFSLVTATNESAPSEAMNCLRQYFSSATYNDNFNL